MTDSQDHHRADAIVVGSGPGGATTARQLARGGRAVIILERGIDHRDKPYYGTHLGAMLYTDRASFVFTEEGVNIIRPLMVGGATGMFAGTAAEPPSWLADRYGVSLDTEVKETIDELQIEPLAPDERGAASTRVAEAAQELGYDWQPLPKFIRPARTPDFDCGSKCMLGCRCGAKWNAGEYVEDAVAAGARLMTGTRVEQVLVDHGHVAGVRARRGGRSITVEAPLVVLAAGGLGSPRILQASGFDEAGRGLTLDTTVMVYGVAPYAGIAGDPPMTWGWEDEERGVMFSTLLDPWLNYPVAVARTAPGRIPSWRHWRNTMGVMIKLRDDLSGAVPTTGKIRKPLTEGDSARLAWAEDVARSILTEASADPDTFFTTPLRGTHPSSTVRLGELVDTDLQTSIPGLHVCDASVFPEALGRPTVLTIIALAKRLTAHLLDEAARDERPGRPA